MHSDILMRNDQSVCISDSPNPVNNTGNSHKNPNLYESNISKRTTSLRNLNIYSSNIFSLMSHLDELRLMIEDKKPHIIGINETKIDQLINDSVINNEGYEVVHRDRNKFGGGVALYIHKSINFKVREDLMKYDIETISVQIKIGNYKPFIVTSIYGPPKVLADKFSEIEALVATIDNENKESIIIGDTNCNYDDPSNHYTKHLKKIISAYKLTQLINEPTRTTATSQTIIDHIITNKPDCVLDFGVIPCGISDHDIIFLIKNMRVPKLKAPSKVLDIRNYKRFDLKAFQNDIKNIPFDYMKEVSKDVNELWELWKTFFLDIIEKHAPMIQIRVKGNRLPYVTSELRRMIRQRDYLRGKANKTGSRILRQAWLMIK